MPLRFGDNHCRERDIKYVSQLEDGSTLPNPSLVVNNYASEADIIKRLVKRALRMHSFGRNLLRLSSS